MLACKDASFSHCCYMHSLFEEVERVAFLFEYRQASAEEMQKVEELKNEGNHAFFSRDLAKAVSCYSQALSLNPTSATLHTNRSDPMCRDPV